MLVRRDGFLVLKVVFFFCRACAPQIVCVWNIIRTSTSVRRLLVIPTTLRCLLITSSANILGPNWNMTTTIPPSLSSFSRKTSLLQQHVQPPGPCRRVRGGEQAPFARSHPEGSLERGRSKPNHGGSRVCSATRYPPRSEGGYFTRYKVAGTVLMKTDRARNVFLRAYTQNCLAVFFRFATATVKEKC